MYSRFPQPWFYDAAAMLYPSMGRGGPGGGGRGGPMNRYPRARGRSGFLSRRGGGRNIRSMQPFNPHIYNEQYYKYFANLAGIDYYESDYDSDSRSRSRSRSRPRRRSGRRSESRSRSRSRRRRRRSNSRSRSRSRTRSSRRSRSERGSSRESNKREQNRRKRSRSKVMVTRAKSRSNSPKRRTRSKSWSLPKSPRQRSCSWSKNVDDAGSNNEKEGAKIQSKIVDTTAAALVAEVEANSSAKND